MGATRPWAVTARGRGAGVQGPLAGRTGLPDPQVPPRPAAHVPLDGAAGPGARHDLLPGARAGEPLIT